ncbi:Tumor protein p63-regulated 1 protein [Tupaia chinensis]|uniref:Tumor protein p63-regulated 1 protein n=1 Tax=Tupaia chinensis TaxID=246437 RepID=L9JKS1_TUPCH|nr:Tumor protein p63-regulated 1 protein [Tupaia chinensis]
MSTIGSFEGFQPVSLKQEGDDQPSETDHLSMEEEGPGKDPVPKQISRQPSVTESTLYPNPFHQPYVSRKYFVTRPGAIETAMEDLKGHIAETSEETIQGFWLLTETSTLTASGTRTMKEKFEGSESVHEKEEQWSQRPGRAPRSRVTAGSVEPSLLGILTIDHWNNEKEKILLVTDKTLFICKYDFIMLSCVQLQRIPLSAIYRICLGKFAFPGISLDKSKSELSCV